MGDGAPFMTIFRDDQHVISADLSQVRVSFQKNNSFINPSYFSQAARSGFVNLLINLCVVKNEILLRLGIVKRVQNLSES
jgi:hypothetical protein